ncbi:hypothetical protein SAMN05443244_0938 [Terriglobus roseus]|uniref:Uncharacterized protein n=1 Tax=Terriglobus roseus TaxID=392734 RepID=A0A1H4K210_9BACT|nr:hypothetical protein SAMN05443244_0938 [Terriglobus roseus]
MILDRIDGVHCALKLSTQAPQAKKSYDPTGRVTSVELAEVLSRT